MLFKKIGFSWKAALTFLVACAPIVASAQVCTVSLSAGSSVGAAITNASPGATICLGDGNYPGFTLNGVSKEPRVTVRGANPPASVVTGEVRITGDSNGFTFDGLTFGYVTIDGANTRNITFRNYVQKNEMSITGITASSPNILLDTFTMKDLDIADTSNTAGIYLDSYPAKRTTPIATIRNATIDGGCADGIQTGTVFILENSRVMNKQTRISSGRCTSDPHTDGVQFYGGPFRGTIVRNNFFYRNTQVLSAFDGVDGVLIENNIFDPGPDGEMRPCQIEWYSDDSSIIRHNTILYRGAEYGQICLERKATDDAGFGTVVTDNIANSINTADGSTIAQRSNNLVRTGATAGDIAGAPTFVGGSAPGSINGFALTVGSLGKLAALAPAGGDVGADISKFALFPTPNSPTALQIN